jgi:hypothetical protein
MFPSNPPKFSSQPVAKNLNDKIHFPPFAGFKLTEPMHNLSFGNSSKDIFLW